MRSVHICDDTIYKAKKADFIHRKLLYEKLRIFKAENHELKALRNVADEELKYSQRLIKKEVIEMADRLEQMDSKFN